MPRLTLSMIVHNEADRYLGEVLASAKEYVDDAVIVDDASTDDTIDVVANHLDGMPFRIIHNAASKFEHEISLRRQQWEETLATNPEWVLTIDADEVFEKSFGENVRKIIEAATVASWASYAFYFRLYDMWSETHYRDDQWWGAHHYYRPFLIRPGPAKSWQWRETAQHCGRFPLDVSSFPYECLAYRLKHLGWSRLEDRAAKYERYMCLDPQGVHGWLDQYKSIMDAHPQLAAWEE